MIKKFKPVLLLLLAGVSFLQLRAQDNDNDNDNDNDSGNESIIIHKKGDSKEKVTVVIDGDNITVNGKPIDDFKSDNIDIIKQDDMPWVGSMNGRSGGMSWVAPAMPQMHAFRDDMMKIHSNSAFLGVMSETTDEGAKITQVTKESAAQKAGLQLGDVITKVGDDKVSSPDDLYKAIGKHKPDEKVTITYLRNGKQATTQATLGKSDQMKVYSWNTPEGGFHFRNGEPYDFAFAFDGRPRLGIEAQDTEDANGVKITDVDEGDDESPSPAAKAGLKEGDVITQVNGKAIKSVDELRESLKDVKKGDTVKITYKRNNQTQTIDVKFPRELKTIDL